ncbi:MAG: S1C family serine protease [Acidobacteriota bacterium]|nr:S1C family serine protease [Acidobacteriota bacterium]
MKTSVRAMFKNVRAIFTNARSVNLRLFTACAALLALCPAAAGARAVPAQVSAQRQQRFDNNVLDAVVTILVEADGDARPVGSGLVMRGDGVVVTALHLVRDARNVQVRLRNGETFDRAAVVATDGRRDVAILRVPAAGLVSLSGAATEEGWVGSTVAVVSAATGGAEEVPTGVLTSVALADEVPGAGRGYRVIRFSAPVPPASVGGLLVDERGDALGLVTAQPQSRGQAYALPLSSVVGMVRSVGAQIAAPYGQNVGAGAPYSNGAYSNAPYAIPQSQVSVPQRPTLPLEARGPGSVVVRPSRPVDLLLASKTLYVRSVTNFFKPEQLVNELNKRAEIGAWGLACVEDQRVADLVLTIDHVVFTYKFTFTIVHQRTGVVVASGSRIIWDGNLGAPEMAERVVEKLKDVRAQQPSKPEAAQEKSKK